jgi:DNA-binding NtrC family response regulator
MHSHQIMIVDRASNIRSVVAQLLDDEGFDVVTANGNEEALRRLLAFRPAVILVEVESAEDLEAISQLSSNSEGAEIIAVAPFGRTALSLDAMSCGASGYMMKPFSRIELLVAVHRAVEHYDLSREVAELRLELGRPARAMH